MAPMAGASPVALAAAVCNGGGMGACGVLGMSPQEIQSWSTSPFEAQNPTKTPLLSPLRPRSEPFSSRKPGVFH